MNSPQLSARVCGSFNIVYLNSYIATNKHGLSRLWSACQAVVLSLFTTFQGFTNLSHFILSQNIFGIGVRISRRIPFRTCIFKKYRKSNVITLVAY